MMKFIINRFRECIGSIINLIKYYILLFLNKIYNAISINKSPLKFYFILFACILIGILSNILLRLDFLFEY